MRLTRTFLHDTLSFTFLVNTFGATGDQGAFQRYTLEYDLMDSIEITGGAVLYQGGDLRRTQSIGSNDRLYLEIQYNF